MDLSTKKMVPFHLRAFPPRRLNRRRFAKSLERANRLLNEYNTLLAASPWPQRLFFQLVNLEVIASIESQKVKISLEDFLRLLLGKQLKKNSKFRLISNYREALIWACKHAQNSSLTKELICTLHKKAKRETVAKADLGVYRNRQNWIGPKGCKIEDAYFYPPAATEVKDLMQKLFNYAKKDENEPLLQLALIFAQFLIIHPFMDGNGRVARILIPLFLYQKKVTLLPLLFMSRYFLQHRLQYFSNLFRTTEENKWETWIAFFLEGIIIEMRRELSIFKQIHSLSEEMERHLPELKKKTLVFLFQNPVFSISSFQKSKGNEYLLNKLIKLQLVKKHANGIYSFSPLLKILKHRKKQ
jgi:Fic family protein